MILKYHAIIIQYVEHFKLIKFRIKIGSNIFDNTEVWSQPIYCRNSKPDVAEVGVRLEFVTVLRYNITRSDGVNILDHHRRTHTFAMEGVHVIGGRATASA